MKIALKELRETFVNLKIIKQKTVLKIEIITDALNESNELISNFVKSIQPLGKICNE